MIGSLVFIGLLVILSIFLTNYFSDFKSEWYKSLETPSFQPPPVAFSVIWTFLYIIIWLTISITYSKDRTILFPFLILLTLLVLWAFVYFKLQSLWGASIVLLITLVVSFIVWKKMLNVNQNSIVPSSFFLFIAWIFVATTLNITSAIKN
jgi:benzodiazapine receptor